MRCIQIVIFAWVRELEIFAVCLKQSLISLELSAGQTNVLGVIFALALGRVGELHTAFLRTVLGLVLGNWKQNSCLLVVHKLCWMGVSLKAAGGRSDGCPNSSAFHSPRGGCFWLPGPAAQSGPRVCLECLGAVRYRPRRKRGRLTADYKLDIFFFWRLHMLFGGEYCFELALLWTEHPLLADAMLVHAIYVVSFERG